MKLRRRTKNVAVEENEGASTSFDGASSRRSASVIAEKSEPYQFPSNLVKERHWKERAVSKKIESEAANCVDLIAVFDFFKKLHVAFSLTPVTEQQLEEAIVSERSSKESLVLIKMIVELFNGFSSIDYSHHVRMYQRNRVYHDTNTENFNQSLWVFFDHDWRFLSPERWAVENILGPSKGASAREFAAIVSSLAGSTDKEKADFFALPFRIRSALLLDLCIYRLSCPDAQDVVDSAEDEKFSIGAQLRTDPIGTFENADFYYFGGLRVYRSKTLTKKKLQKQKIKKKFSVRSSAPSSLNHKIVEVGAGKTGSNVADGSMIVETAEKRVVTNEIATVQEVSATLSLSEKDHLGFGKVAGTESDGLNAENVDLLSDKKVFDMSEALNQDYFINLNDQSFIWEVVCADEEDLHFLIEYLRITNSAGSKALREKLIDKVLPSVRDFLQKQREQEKAALKAMRFFPQAYDASIYGDFELRHSRRLEQKRIEREKQLEERRRMELQAENMIREFEGKRKIQANEVTESIPPKISREERLRLREQRILEQEAQKKKRLEEPKNSSLVCGRENKEPGVFTNIPSLDCSGRGLTYSNVKQTEDARTFVDSNGFRANRRKQSFDVAKKWPLANGRKGEESNRMISRVSNWDHLSFRNDQTLSDQKEQFFQTRKCTEDVDHFTLYEEKRYHKFQNTGLHQLPFVRNQTTFFPGSHDLPTTYSSLSCNVSTTANGFGKDFRNQLVNYPGDSQNGKSIRNYTVGNAGSSTLEKRQLTSYAKSVYERNAVKRDWETSDCKGMSTSVDNSLSSGEKQDSDSEVSTEIIVSKYLDYPSAESAECFRIVVPDGSYMTLLASGPLLDHDYIVPPVELIIDQKWKFCADPINPNSAFQPIEFSLQKQEPILPADELVDVET